MLSIRPSIDISHLFSLILLFSMKLNVSDTSTTELSQASSDSSKADEQSSNNNSTVTATTETFVDDYDEVSNESEKSEVENIQDESQESQENSSELEEQFARNNSSFGATIKVYQDPLVEKPIHGGHIALIFASTLVVLSVIAYVGLVLWRSHLEKRYGMRQRLVTEDVFYSDNQNDVRYFGL